MKAAIPVIKTLSPPEDYSEAQLKLATVVAQMFVAACDRWQFMLLEPPEDR